MTHVSESLTMKTARIYLRVSSESQDLERQKAIRDQAIEAGYYIAGTYAEKASGARADRPELLRMIDDLQTGDVVIAERMDRISRLPLDEAQKLIDTIKAKGARLAIPGVVDLSELASNAKGVAKVVLDSVQKMLLDLALQMARDDYETRRERQRQGIDIAKREKRYAGRKADDKANTNIIAHRLAKKSIAETAELVGCSTTHVKRVWKAHQAASNAI